MDPCGCAHPWLRLTLFHNGTLLYEEAVNGSYVEVQSSQNPFAGDVVGHRRWFMMVLCMVLCWFMMVYVWFMMVYVWFMYGLCMVFVWFM